jgi:hypothetical protein
MRYNAVLIVKEGGANKDYPANNVSRGLIIDTLSIRARAGMDAKVVEAGTGKVLASVVNAWHKAEIRIPANAMGNAAETYIEVS